MSRLKSTMYKIIGFFWVQPVLIGVQTVCKGNQLTTTVATNMKRIKHLLYVEKKLALSVGYKALPVYTLALLFLWPDFSGNWTIN